LPILEQARRVLGHQQDAIPVLQSDDGSAARDTLAGILGLVLHHLLGADVVGERHGQTPCSLCVRSLRIASQTRRTSSSPMSVNPERVTVFTVGKIPRTRSGPPVPTSSSAASIRASSEARSASSRYMRSEEHTSELQSRFDLVCR